MENLIQSVISVLQNNLPKNNMPDILFDSPEINREYNDKRQIFNTYYQFRPTAMVFCTNAEQVSAVITCLRDWHYKGDLRVRSGGHDHEGECSGTDAVVIDLSEMKSVTINAEKNYATIQPGIMFIDLIKAMNDQNVGLPHGTCYSVRIAGFTFGGGWGPWTRQKGMGCESLAGVTIVLGDGTIKTIIDNKLIPDYNGTPVKDLDDEDRKLLWALRGGGGMSYGVVTELIYKTFTLPDYTTKFTIAWETKHPNIPPAVKLLQRWEQLIDYGQNVDLLGTNLKMVAKHKSADDTTSVEDSKHDTYFYGYYMGSKAQFASQTEFEDNLKNIITNDWFPVDQYLNYTVSFEDKIEAILSNNVTSGVTGKLTAIPDQMKREWSPFSAWDRIIKWDTGNHKNDLLESKYDTSALPPHYQAIPPEIDKPAPHKITSRLAIVTTDEQLAQNRRLKLIESLESDLLYDEGTAAGMTTYFTLGAITGDYYKDYDYQANVYPQGSAMPYKKCYYTIQYQAWWNNDGKINPHVQPYVNRAIDWLEVCRNYDIPGTYGSFISFKDDSIPTRIYFQESYDLLKEIKEKYVHDPENMLSSRKTII